MTARPAVGLKFDPPLGRFSFQETMTTAAQTTLTDHKETFDPELDPAGRPLTDRDRKRGALAPYRTRIAPLHEGTRRELCGYKPPLGKAYVLFEKWSIEIVGEAERSLTYGLYPFSVDDRPEQYTKIERMVRKGFRILDWGNFYSLTDRKKERAQKAQAHNNAWAELDQALTALVANPNILAENVELKDENTALKQKLREFQERLAKEAEAEVAAKDAKKGAK